jgi:hypothetical protein
LNGPSPTESWWGNEVEPWDRGKSDEDTYEPEFDDYVPEPSFAYGDNEDDYEPDVYELVGPDDDEIEDKIEAEAAEFDPW